MTQDLPLFAACQPGLEPFLLAELEALDIQAASVPGGATYIGARSAVRGAEREGGPLS